MTVDKGRVADDGNLDDTNRNDAALKEERQRRYRVGWWAEFFVSVFLMARGYRVLARRARTVHGEIDLVVVRGQRLSFIEVKARRSREAAESSLSPRQRQRIKRASLFWMKSHPRFHNYEITFDLVFVLPWRLPYHIVNGI
ncbi:MAG: YraN family protein [Pseudomonadota bacterium]